MTGPNGVRDKKGASGTTESSDRRRRGAAASSLIGTRGAIKNIRHYVFSRKFTLMYLLVLIILAFAIRSVWYYDAAYTGGPSPLLSGNDPDYHKRTVDYFVNNHHFLQRDPLLNYPGGGPNPNPPAYSTSIALVGHALSPFFDGGLEAAVWFAMEIGAALWAALTVIPVYLFTKEMFGRKSAYFAAFFIAVMAGNIERTPLGFSDHDAFFMFFIVTGFFFFLKALRKVKTKTYVKNWRDPRDVTLGMSDFGRTNKEGLLYAGMAGIALGAVALSWKGFPYALAIIFVYLLFHLLINKFRRIDNTAIALTVFTTVSILMLMSLPYYINMNFMNWYEAPAILYAAVCLVVAVFLFTRDMPWLLIIPVLLLIIVVALTAVWFLLPDVWTNIFSGAGYFIRTKLYGTIAEAQPPDINRLVFSYGMTTFFLALVGVFIMIKNLPKGWKNDQIFTAIWALVSMYMAVSAIRFMYNATPVFAILAGWITWDVLKRLDFKRMIRVFRSMKGDFYKALKSAVKLRHVAGALFLAFLILAPNLWHGVDAGIPYETKKDADLAVYEFMPEFMRPSSDLYDPDSNNLWYFGSFGTSFMSDYWAQGMWWLSEQDTWEPEEDRPAFISWWDYGHWCVQVGKHPTAADNFQNGVEFAGNFIASQGEDEASALMIVRLFQLNRKNPEVVDFMRSQLGDLVTEELLDLFTNAKSFTHLIKEYPERYRLKDVEVSNLNTIFIHGTYLVEKNTDPEQMVDILLWFSNVVGDEYRYFAVDSRLMPVSYRNTGIFYAPITLSDNRVDEYIEIVAIFNGNQMTLDQAAELSTDDRANLQYQLLWKKPFFDSMFYRAFIGYSGYDQGPDFKDTGIPFVSGDLAQSPPLPGWNMSHWRVAHRTIHWNPYNDTEVQDHPNDWRAISYEEALEHAENDEGILDDSIRSISSGVIYLKYYAGAWINGTVTTETGEPISGATITVHDDYRSVAGYFPDNFVGIPHGTTQTDENGSYSILAPYGNVTVVASNGGNMDYTVLHEANLLNQSNIYISDEAAMRQGEYNFTVDLLVPTAYQNGTLFADVNNNGDYEELEDHAFGNATMFINGTRGLNKTYELTTYPDGYYELDDGLPGEYSIEVVYNGHTIEDGGFLVLAPNGTKEENIALHYSSLRGVVTRLNGTEVEGTPITIRDLQTNVTLVVEAEAMGQYEVKELLPGNYSVELFVPGTRPINESVALTDFTGVELNLTLLPIAFLEGVVYSDDNENGIVDQGEGIVNATITFDRLYSSELVWTTVTDETGHYNTSLPTGLYSTYIHEIYGTDHLAGLTNIDIDADDLAYTMNFSISQAFRVNGTLKRHTTDTNKTIINAGRTPVDIWNDGARLEVTANSTGAFAVYLPKDNYSLMMYKSIKSIEDRQRLNLSHLIVNDEAIDLGEVLLENGTVLRGDVIFDKNGDGTVGKEEVQPNINIVFEVDGHRLNATTTFNGTYSLPAPNLYYNASIEAAAFEPFFNFTDATNTSLTEVPKTFKLIPNNVTYSGLAGYDWNEDGNLSDDGFADLLITFEADSPATTNPNAVTTNVTTDADGHYTLELAPGVYNVKVQLDTDEDMVTIRYSHEDELDIHPSTEEGAFNVWLERLVKVNGTVVFEDSDDPVHNKTINSFAANKKIKVVNGTFEGYLPTGEHTLEVEASRGENAALQILYRNETIVDLDRPMTLNITLYKKVMFSGRLIYDWNGNGSYDPLDEQVEGDKPEGIKIDRFTIRGLTDYGAIVDSEGNFTAALYPHDNYTLLISEIVDDSGTEYEWFLNQTVDISQNVTMDMTLQRRFEVSGRVFWDKDENNESVPSEGILNATVTLRSEDGKDSYEIVTFEDGFYHEFVLVDNDTTAKYLVTASHPGFTPNETEWEFNVTISDPKLDLPMKPLNVTIDGLTFHDQNSNGMMNHYESASYVEHIKLWEVTNVSNAHDLTTDLNGTFNVSLRPGSYNVQAWTEAIGGYLVNLGVLDVEATGGSQEVHLGMTIGRMVSGSMYYFNHTSTNHSVPELNLTFTPLDGKGEVPIDVSGPSRYSAVLPEGRYRVNGSFSDEEFGVEMTYMVDEHFRLILRDRTDVDLNFSKVEEYKLELWWDDVAPVHIGENASYNFTIFAKNVGSMNGTFDLGVTVPNSWLWETEVDNITLNLSQQTSFWLLINSSEQANAEVHTLTVFAQARNGTDEASEMDLEININQHYDFELRPAQQIPPMYVYDINTGMHHLSYSFEIANLGNGNEVLNFTASAVLDWTIDLTRLEQALGPYQVEPVIPIEIDVPNLPLEMRSQTLTITAVPSNSPDKTPKTLEIELSFPDLYMAGDDVAGEIDGEYYDWDKNDAPGFGPLMALLAIAGAALVTIRRRR